MVTRWLMVWMGLFVFLMGCGSDDSKTDVSDAADSVEHDGGPEMTIDMDVLSDTDLSDLGDVTDSTDTADAVDTPADIPPDVPADVPVDGAMDMTTLEGFGDITGMCGVLAMTELTDTNPYVFENAIDFGMDPFDDPADVMFLTVGGQQILADGNAGGSSLESEIFAYEVLARCEGATLLKTEKDIIYDTMGDITDFLVDIDGNKIGVSVTRAVAFPFDDPFSVATAQMRLEDKLASVNESTMNVSAEDAWEKQVLAVIAYGPMHAMSLQTALGQIDPGLKADTIVYITVTNGDDAFIY